jgi:hypothetical protein
MRLYDLYLDNDVTVAELHSLGWGEGGEGWVWRRRLLAWEEELAKESRTLLAEVFLQNSITDRWEWRPSVGDGYTVRCVYQMVTR